MSNSSARHKEALSEIFDDAAVDFDSSGLDFFTPLGVRLAQIADSRTGQEVLDVGCGLGSSLLPAAVRVGPAGSVTGIDLAPGMVRELSRIIEHQGLVNVRVLQMDGEQLEFPPRSFDVVQAGFSIMHFPSAPACLERYARILRPGGQLCFSDLVDDEGLPDLVPADVFAVLEPFFPASVPDPRDRGRDPWTASEDSIRSALLPLGFTVVEVVDEVEDLDVGSGERWNAWTMSTGLRQAWSNVPAADLDAVRARAAELIERRRDDRGRLRLPVRVRYVVSSVAREG